MRGQEPGEEENMMKQSGAAPPVPLLPAVKRARPGRLHLTFPPAVQAVQLPVAPADPAGLGSPLSPISANPSILGGRKRRKGSGVHEFHSLVGKQQQTMTNGNNEYYDIEAPVETAQLPNVGPTRVLPHLYIGSQADALDAEVMRRFGITHVLNVSIACPQSQHVPGNNFLRIPVNDGYTDKLLPHFQRSFKFLESVRESSGRCLVHCLAGISRSPTLSIAYIMKHRRMSQDEAYRFVKQQRRHISPNFNFLGQLLEFERQLRRAGEGAAAHERPDVKRQRTSDRSPTSALSQLSFRVAPPGDNDVLIRRPRSVLIQGGGSGGGGPTREQPVRRSRSSDAFLDLEDDAVRCREETPVGAVACLS